MKLKHSIITLLVVTNTLTTCVTVDKKQTIPEFRGHVNDYYNLLTQDQHNKLTKMMHNVLLKCGAQMAVLIIDSTNNITIQEYSLKVARRWRLGRKNIDDGVLFTFAMKDRRLRIEVGLGLEGLLTNGKCQEIVDTMIVFFKQGNYYSGISKGVSMASNILIDNAENIIPH